MRRGSVPFVVRDVRQEGSSSLGVSIVVTSPARAASATLHVTAGICSRGGGTVRSVCQVRVDWRWSGAKCASGSACYGSSGFGDGKTRFFE